MKGRLKAHVDFWQELGSSEFILNTIGQGYRLPFISVPPKAMFKNNRSAIENSSFVKQAIDELLSSGRVREVFSPPHVVSPLSVSCKGAKKRLILDLRYVNSHVRKNSIKFDDWKVMQHYMEKGAFMFKFDIKQGYHHVDIHEGSQMYLGFSWVDNGVTRFFVFAVLPFGLTSAPYIFTKIVRVLVKYWRGLGVKFCCYIDDGLGTNLCRAVTQQQSHLVRSTLHKSGFVSNDAKSVWDPTQSTVWLGIDIDLAGGFLRISQERENSVLGGLDSLIGALPYTSARTISKVTGKLLSTKFILGDLTRLKTRCLYGVIARRFSWDGRVNLARESDVISQLHFWRDNFHRLNVKSLEHYEVPTIVATSDASATGLAGHMEFDGRLLVAYRNFSPTEAACSSTWRELIAINFSLQSFSHLLRGKTVVWRTDNYAASLIVPAGSRIPVLQIIAEEIYNHCVALGISLTVQWVPRESIQLADTLSKIPDHDDWETTPAFFEELTRLWGPFEVDRFAGPGNAKLPRFNSKFHCAGTEQVNAFSVSWKGCSNYLVPPVSAVPRVIEHMAACGAPGVLVAPFWPSASFFPLLIGNDGQFRAFVADFRVFSPWGRVAQGKNLSVLIGSAEFRSPIFALKLQF